MKKVLLNLFKFIIYGKLSSLNISNFYLNTFQGLKKVSKIRPTASLLRELRFNMIFRGL